MAWWIVHGPAIWKIALVLGAALGAWVAWMTQRGAAARRARRARAALGRPAATLDGLAEGAIVTLRGRLAARAPLARRFDDGRPAAVAGIELFAGRALYRACTASSRAAGLTLRLGDRDVECVGDLEVVAGSVEAARGRLRLEQDAYRAVTDAGVELPPSPQAVTRALNDGDEVLVRGALQLVGCDGGYRTQAARWGLGGPGASVQVAAVAPPRVASSRMVIALGALGGLAATAGGFLVAGQLALRAYRAPEDDRYRNIDLLAVAAVSPFHRDEALDELDELLHSHLDSVPASLELLALVRRLRSGCAAGVVTLAEHGSPRPAAYLGERCGDREALARAAEAWFVVGELERASAALERAGEATTFAVRVHLLAGRIELAGLTARAAAARAITSSEAEILACVAEWTDGRRGTYLACGRRPEDRGPLVELNPRHFLVPDPDVTGRLLRTGTDAAPPTHPPGGITDLPWRAQIALDYAVFESLAGEHVQARRWMRLAVEDLGALAIGDHRWRIVRDRAILLQAALELRAGAFARASDLLVPFVERPSRAADELLAVLAAVERADYRPLALHVVCVRQSPDLVDLAATGSGVAAVELVRRCADTELLLRLLGPRLDRDRGAVLRTWRTRYDGTRRSGRVLDAMARATERADIAAALGDAGLANEWRSAAARRRSALYRRDVASPLLALEPWSAPP